MRKITLLIILFVISTGYSQTLLQGFESAGSINGAPFGGMPAPVVEAGTGSNTSQVLKIVANPTQQPWQGINLFLSPSTNLTVNKTLTIDVLSDEEITFLVKVTTGGAIAAAPVTHNGDGTWQTLSFTFNTSLDGQAANPSGTYSGFVIHAYWTNDGGTSFFPGGNPIPRPPRTFYVDNIREPAPAPPITGDVYINDNSLVGDVFCSAVGQDIGTATGSTSLPYKNITDLFADRVISPGATIHVDSGTYTGRTVLQDNEDGIPGSVITIKGAGTGLTFLNSTLNNDAVIKFNNADYFTVKDMTISSATEYYQIWTTPGSTNCTFDNLVLVNTKSATQGWAYVLQGSFATITNNVITSDYVGVDALSGSSNTNIIGNKIFGNNATYGIWFQGNSSTHSVINNMVSNFKQAFRSDGTSTSNCNLYNNSFSGTEYGCVGYMTGWNVKNNIFSTSSNNAENTAFWYGAAQPPATLDHNLYYHPNAARAVTRYFPTAANDVYASLADFVVATAYEDNGVEGNPLFVSATDLHLQPGSPAIGAGTDVGVTEDIDGDPRPLSGTFDIGADEFTVTVSSDATLSDLQVNGVSIPGFSPVITDYTLEVSCSDSSIPQITSATPTSSLASVVITQATDVFEDATVVVTAEDGVTTETYTIRIVLATSDIIQGFEPPATYTGLTGDNGTTATIEPSPGGVSGNSLQLVSTSGGLVFQAGFFDQVSDFVVLTPENNTVQVDVFSTQAFNLRLKLEIGAGPIERTVQYTTPNAWQTLTYDFGAVNATYQKIVFFLNSNATNDGFLPSQNFTAFVDNISLSSVQTERITYTYDNGWSATGNPIGNSNCVDTINVISGNINITADTEADNLTIQPGASVTVNSGITLETTTVDLNSTSQQYSSLIVEGALEGTVNYNRYTASVGPVGTNDLIASPVSGQDFGSFAAANPNLAASGPLRVFGPYETNNGTYVNYDITGNASTEIVSGIGYRAATDDGSPLTFTGTALTGDLLDVPISDASAGSAWNLIGNPYPSYLDFAAFFAANQTQFDADGAFQAIYGYDGSATNGWTVWNSATIADNTVIELIAPGQSFFVKSKTNGGLVDFTTGMRTSGSSDDFILGRSASSLNVALSNLTLTSSANSANTNIYFIEGTTRGLDPGYDAGAYFGASGGFSIFTNLVEDNEGLDMTIQSLPYNDFNDVVIPVGVNASSQGQLTIGLGDNSTVPFNVNVYLEDTLENTLTLLNTSDYTFTSTTNLVGTGRFFLRYSSDTLSLSTNEALDDIIIFTNESQNNIIIKGILTAATQTDLYDIQGRLVLSEKLDQSSITNAIDVSSISSGIYIVQVSNKNSTKTQKLIIK